MFALNVLAPMRLIQALLPILKSRSSTIVNIGSGFGSIAFAGYCAYSASKFALRGFTEALRRELSDSSVQVLYLAPRATQTEMNSTAVIDMNKALGTAMDSPERVVDELMVLLAKSQRSRFIGWPERFFIKLNSVFPALVDKALAKQLAVIKQFALAANNKDQ
jgi:short-subunit dehydrogenase